MYLSIYRISPYTLICPVCGRAFAARLRVKSFYCSQLEIRPVADFYPNDHSRLYTSNDTAVLNTAESSVKIDLPTIYLHQAVRTAVLDPGHSHLRTVTPDTRLRQPDR